MGQERHLGAPLAVAIERTLGCGLLQVAGTGEGKVCSNPRPQAPPIYPVPTSKQEGGDGAGGAVGGGEEPGEWVYCTHRQTYKL